METEGSMESNSKIHLDGFKKGQVLNSEFVFRDIRFLDDLEVERKSVFLRLDLNIPIKRTLKNEVDDSLISKNDRLQKSLPTLRYLLERKAKVVIGAHLGRPKTKEDKERLSLEPIARNLRECLNLEEVLLTESPLSSASKVLLSGLKSPGQVLMLENLRWDISEEQNLSSLALILSECVDIYINDAFGASHRKHASLCNLPRSFQRRGMGFLMKKEIEVLNKISKSQDSFALILGGNKVRDKIGVIRSLVEKKRDFLLLVGGAMAYTFLLANGASVDPVNVEREKLEEARDLLYHLRRQGRVLLPLDHRILPIGESGPLRLTEGPEIEEGWRGVDIGPKTIKLYRDSLQDRKVMFWNGPMGIFEKEGCEEGTFQMLDVLSKSDAFTVIGGGDSAVAAQKRECGEKMDHISTGGGASLEYLKAASLPGIEALRG